MIRMPLVLFLLIKLITCASAAEIHVSSEGKDAASGTLASPLRTIQAAVDRAYAGDTVIVHGGIYREAVIVAHSGEPQQPLRIIVAEGERVVVDGTEVVAGPWQQQVDGVWSAAVEGPVQQVFLGEAMLVEARWPNMRFADDLWNRDCWASAGDGSDKGVLVDSKLAESGVDWTGATAMLNVSHQFWTWTCPVTQHATGSDRLAYDASKASGIKDANGHIRFNDDYYYLFGVRAALDVPSEWFFDADAGRLYVIPPNSRSIGPRTVRIKRRDFGLTLRDVQHVEVHGLWLFGCAFQIEKGQDCVIAACHARFPSHSRLAVERTGGRSPCASVSGNRNRIDRCSLAFASGAGLAVNGNENTIDNNLIHDVCWNGSLDYGAIRVSGDRNVVCRNTVFNSGNLLISHHGQANVIELNHVYDGGWACRDLSMIYSVTPRAAGSVVRHNWVHGCHAPHLAMGIRADDKSRDITIHHNVIWDCGWEGIVCKGDRHRVFNNTSFDNGHPDILLYVGPEQDKDWQRQWKALADQNTNSLVYNNAVQAMYGDRGHSNARVRPGGEEAGNYEADDVKQHLRDPDRLDFRPKPGSPLVDRGRPVPGCDVVFHDKAPDAGAYELGGDNWIPGITWDPKDVLGADPVGWSPRPREAEQSVNKKDEHPAASLANEPLLPEPSLEKATAFLDAGARAHETKCINCHASFAYLMARPALPIVTEKHGDVRKTLEDWVAYLEGLQLDTTSDPRRRAEAVMSGAVLAQHDAETTGELHPVTRRALDLMWQVQLPDGGYDWLKPNNEPPSAIDDHYGATMAAIAAGIAPGGYADSPKARPHIDKLRGYLRTHPPQHMHQRGMLMLADHFLGGLMSEQERRQTVSDLFELQHPDGGWALAALGDDTWKRKDRTPQDLATSDGYGTGFAAYVLRTAGGVPAEDGRIQRAVAWLKSNQRASGGWYSRSPKNKDALSSYVGSAYAVMALKACGDESR